MIVHSPYPPIAIPDVTLSEFVMERFRAHADQPALIDAASGRTLTFGQIAGGVRAMSAGLARRGFVKGDVFAVWLPNLPEYAIAFLGITSAGGVVTTVNPLYTAAECASQMRETGARFLLTIPQFVDKALEVKRDAGLEEIFVLGEAPGAAPFTQLLATGGEPPSPGLDPAHDLAALPCSSGTTGRAKAVMLTHRNLVAQLCQAELVFAPEDLDRPAIAVLPFFHIYGMVLILLLGLRRATPLVSMMRFELEPFLAAIEKYRIAQASLVPPIILALAKHPAVDKYDLSSLKRIGSGAAPLAKSTEEACAQRLSCVISQGWGMTELTGAGISHGRLEEGRIRHGSVGVPWPGLEARIVDVATGVELPSGERGELCVRGPNVTRGYLNQPEATASTIDADGWLHTGDVAYFDGEGYFYIVDRVKELIKYNAYQVAPAELEAVLVTHPAVADAAVIPSADPEAGEVPKAIVALKSPATPEELMAYVADRVAPYKKIRAVEIVDAIPRSAAGKVLRRVLIERERARSS
jgi:acyl-CoA synthetase (AMP-forming)/AMP-acid ligase II